MAIEYAHKLRLQDRELSLGEIQNQVLKALKDHVKTQQESSRILLDAQAIQPKGNNKAWEIEVTLFDVTGKEGDWVKGSPVTGYLACHNQGNFTTFSVHLDGRDTWFDKCERALASLVKK